MTQARIVGERLHDELQAGIDRGWRCWRGGAPCPTGVGRAWYLSPRPLSDSEILALGVEVPGPTLHLASADQLRDLTAYLFLTDEKAARYHGDAWEDVRARGQAVLADLDRERSWAVDVDAKEPAPRDALVDMVVRGAQALGVPFLVEPWYSGDSASVHLHFEEHRDGPNVSKELGAAINAACAAGGGVQVKANTWAHPDHGPEHVVDVAGAFMVDAHKQPKILRAQGGHHKTSGAVKRPALDLHGRWPGVGVAGSPAGLIALGRDLLAREAEARAQQQATRRPRTKQEDQPLADLGTCELAATLAWAQHTAAGSSDRAALRRTLSPVLLLLGLRERDVRRVVGAASGSEASRRHGQRLVEGDRAAIAANRRAGRYEGAGLPGFGALRRLVGYEACAALAAALHADTGRSATHLTRRLLGRARAVKARDLAAAARAQAEATSAAHGSDSAGAKHAKGVCACGFASQTRYAPERVAIGADGALDVLPPEPLSSGPLVCRRGACPACGGWLLEAGAEVLQQQLAAHAAAHPEHRGRWDYVRLGACTSTAEAHHLRARLVAGLGSDLFGAWLVVPDGAGGWAVEGWLDPGFGSTVALWLDDPANGRWLTDRAAVRAASTCERVDAAGLVARAVLAVARHQARLTDALLSGDAGRWQDAATAARANNFAGGRGLRWPTRDAILEHVRAQDPVDWLEDAEVDPRDGITYVLWRTADGRHLSEQDRPHTPADAYQHLRRAAAAPLHPAEAEHAAPFVDVAARAIALRFGSLVT